MIPLERYDYNLNIFPPLNFDESNDVVSSEKKEESHFIHQENAEINSAPDLNQPSLNLGEGGGDALFSEEERFEIPRSHHFDPSPPLAVSEKYDAILNERKKLFILNYKKNFEDLTLSLAIDFDVDKWINDMFDREKIRLAKEKGIFSGQAEQIANEIFKQIPEITFNQFKQLDQIKRLRQLYKEHLQETLDKENLQETRVNKTTSIFSYFSKIRKLISTCLKIKKRWDAFVGMLTSCKPFLYEAACFVWKGCKGCTIGLINPSFSWNVVLNYGANEAKIRQIFQSLMQAVNTLQETVSKLSEKNQAVSQENSESYKDKYLALLEENKILQGKHIAELEEGKSLSDRNIELLEANCAKDKTIAELQAWKVDAAAEKPLSTASPVSNSRCGREKTLVGRKRAFSQPQPVMPLLAG